MKNKYKFDSDEYLYKNIRKILTEFTKKNYWSNFTSADIFYFMIKDKERIFPNTRNSLLTFVDSFFERGFGIQLFFTKEGFSYVHNLFTSLNPENINTGDCDSLCAIFFRPEDLDEDERDYIHQNGANIKEDSNLIIYRFKKGYRTTFASKKEEKVLFENLCLLKSIIENEFNDLQDIFKKNLACLAEADPEKLEYKLSYQPLPYLNIESKKEKVHEDFTSDFKDITYLNENCYIFVSYLPIIIEETNIRPLLVYMYYEQSDRSFVRYILDGPKEYHNNIFGIYYDAFTKIGVPIKAIFNDQDIYSISTKTFNKMNIETELNIQNKKLNYMISDVVGKINTQDSDMEFLEEKAVAEALIDAVTSAYSDFDDEKTIEHDDNLCVS